MPRDDQSEKMSLEELSRLALTGDKDALNRLVRALQGGLFGLALRMLCNREDAEDATQEILIRIVTRLSQFDFRSALRTWAYRVAVNYLLDVKKSATERLRLSFEQMAEDLTANFEGEALPEAERSLMVEEVKIGCSLGMLQCLDREHRMAYILGEVMEMQGPEGAQILGISSDLFRKRLQVARSAMLKFMQHYCGLASDSAQCRCNRMVPAAIASGRIAEGPCCYAANPASFEDSLQMVRQVDEARRAVQVHRTASPRPSTIDFAERLIQILDGPQSMNPFRLIQ